MSSPSSPLSIYSSDASSTTSLDDDECQIPTQCDTTIITLNVGGIIHQTTKETLLRCGETYFTSRLSGRFVEQDRHKLFIDRDGTHFRHILNFLRDGNVCVGDDLAVHEQVLQEATFYQLTPLITLLTSRLSALRSQHDERQRHRHDTLRQLQQLNDVRFTSPRTVKVEQRQRTGGAPASSRHLFADSPVSHPEWATPFNMDASF